MWEKGDSFIRGETPGTVSAFFEYYLWILNEAMVNGFFLDVVDILGGLANIEYLGFAQIRSAHLNVFGLLLRSGGYC